MSVQEEYDRMIEMEDNVGFDKYPLKRFNHIGKKEVRRLDGTEKASGRAQYTMDVQLPGMLILKFLISPYPHAEIISMDTSRAEALAGRKGRAPIRRCRIAGRGRLGRAWTHGREADPQCCPFRRRAGWCGGGGGHRRYRR